MSFHCGGRKHWRPASQHSREPPPNVAGTILICGFSIPLHPQIQAQQQAAANGVAHEAEMNGHAKEEKEEAATTTNGTVDSNGTEASAADSNGNSEADADDKEGADAKSEAKGKPQKEHKDKDGKNEQPGEQKTTLKALILSKDVGALIGMGMSRTRYGCEC